METLNALISAAESYNLLKPIDPKVNCQAFLYADDVVIFVQPEERQLVALRAILEVFAAASGLLSNVQKCQASPIQCDLNDTCTILQFFPCRLSPFPCKYLGIPLSIYKLSRAVSGTTIRDTLIVVLRPRFKTQTPDKTSKPTKAHGLLLIQRKGKDSEKPSIWPIRIPLEPAGQSPPRSRVPLRPAGQSPPRSRVANLPSSR